MRFRRWVWLIAVTSATTVAAAAPSAGQASATLIDTPPTNCRASFDPYAYTQSALKSCGYTIVEATKAVALPGGGTGQFYADGSEQLVPPPDFNPLTATAAQLDEYGIPPQPTTDLVAAAKWQTEMKKFNPLPAQAYYVQSPYAQLGTVYDINHAGYVASSVLGSMPTHAEGWYQEPTIYGSVCSSPEEAAWAGLENGNSGYLAQDGTAWNVSGVGGHQAWYAYGQGNQLSPTAVKGLYGSSGILFDASVRRVSWPDVRLYMYDYNTGHTWSKDLNFGLNPTQGEVIIERPAISGGGYTELANFGSWFVDTAYLDGAGFDNIDNVHDGLHMTSNGHSNGTDMADPGFLNSGGSFSVAQHSCH